MVLAREMGVSKHAMYAWKAKVRGVGREEVRSVRQRYGTSEGRACELIGMARSRRNATVMHLCCDPIYQIMII